MQLATQGQASLEVEAPAQEIAAFRIQLPTTQLQVSKEGLKGTKLLMLVTNKL